MRIQQFFILDPNEKPSIPEGLFLFLTKELFSSFCKCFLVVFVLPQHPPGETYESGKDENFIRRKVLIGPLEKMEKSVKQMTDFPPESCLYVHDYAC
jgi:hypothetical protein